MFKRYLRNIIKWMVLFVGLVILYTTFLMVGQAIPRRLVIDNVQKSYEQLDSLGMYFGIVDGASWDNWTDAFFINTTVTEYDGNLLEKALANPYTTKENGGAGSHLEGISYAINGNENAIVESYSRYWAGMMTIYKILLMFVSIKGIRTMIFGIAMILFTASVINVYNLLDIKGLIPYLTSVIIALYIPQAMCLVFNTDIVIMLLMMNICCIMLKRKTSIDTFYTIFFLAGSILAYLNYWAFPLITLGFPLILIVTVRLLEQYDTKLLTIETILISLSWGIGLAGTVLAKQILCKIVLGTQTGTNQILLRMGSEFSINDRFISTVNGLVGRMTSVPVLILTIAVTIWVVLLLKTNRFKRKYKCFLLVFIAISPIVWWFILANHCIHGFVKHMYGVTYYALLSAIFINCKHFVPSLKDLGNVTKKKISVNIATIGIWLLFSYILLNVIIHYGTKETEPWSTEVIDTVNLGEGSVTQIARFDDLIVGEAYLKSIGTILVNIPEDKKDGLLHVEIAENNHVLSKADVSIADIEVGEYFKIPIGCVIHLGREYQITYSVEAVNGLEPYLIVQDDAQAARENGILYVDGVYRTGAVANKYEYDDYILSKKAKISIMFIALFILQYTIFVVEEKNKNRA